MSLKLRLLVKRPAWCLTWRGLLALVVIVGGVLGIGLFTTVPFLSPNRPVEAAEVLVVEGWLPDYALREAAAEFRRGHYRYILTAGSPLLKGYYTSGSKTSAHLAAETLVLLGVPSDLVRPAPGPDVLRGRSIAHARAIKEWLEVHDPEVRGVNVFSLAVHSRRTWRTFQAVMGSKPQVGIIAHPDAGYDADRWWTTSEGFRTVTGEAIAYFWMWIYGHP